MGKKVSECCDKWNNMQTMALADRMDVDAFKPTINNCSSLDDYELKIRELVNSNIEDCKSLANELDPNNILQIMILASLNDIDINQIVNTIMNFYEPQLKVYRLESKVNSLYKKYVKE